MYTGPVAAGATIVTSVALAAAQAVVEQQTQYNETIQRRAERKVETAKNLNAESNNINSANKSKSQGDVSKAAISKAAISKAASVSTPPQSTSPSRGSRVDLRI